MYNQLFDQIYYSTKSWLALRLIALAVVVFGNLIFFVVPGNTVFATLAIVFASFAFMGLWAINLFVSFSNLNGIFKAPRSYLTALAPVSSWKLLLGNIIPAMLFDTVGFVIGITGIFLQTAGVRFYFDNMAGTMGSPIQSYQYFIFAIISGLAFYGLLLTGFLFWRTVSRSILYRFPLRNLLGFVITIAAMMIVSWFNILLIPFGELVSFGPFFSISIAHYTGGHMAVMVLSILLQGAALLLAASYLMNRRINI